MNKVVGFDLDDTLVPEVLLIKSGIRHVAERLHENIPHLPYGRIVSCMDLALITGRNHYSALETLLDEYGLTETVDMKKVVADFRNHMPDRAIYHPAPSMAAILERLKIEGAKLVLITDGRSTTQRNKIKAAGLDAYFEESDIIISEETGHDKHDPDNFLHVMKKYAGAYEFHYVGDNPEKDFIHPSRLGWHIHQVDTFPLAIHHGMPR